MEKPMNESGQENAYTVRNSDVWLAQMESRGAEYLAFLLPHLHPGMRALDCGCGPGAITMALAGIVKPGEVIGVDIDERHIRLAQERSALQPETNVSFQVGSIYKLPFPGRSFDATLACTVLEHLADPAAALDEMYRVLKPGGVVGILDADWDGALVAPQTAMVRDGLKLLRRFAESEGGSQGIGKHLRRLLRQAGFTRVEVTAHYVSYGTANTVQAWGHSMAAMLRESRMVDSITRMGLADGPTLEAMAQAWLAWSEDPDAFLGQPGCTAIGWKD